MLQHLAIVIASLRTGGAERVVSFLANNWSRSGLRVTLITFDSGNALVSYPVDPSINRVDLGLRGSSRGVLHAVRQNIRRIRLLRAVIRRENPDLLLSFIDQTNVLSLLAVMGLPVPVVVSERIDPARHRIGTVWSLLRRFTYRMARLIVVQTDAAAGFFGQRLRHRIRVIPNPLALDRVVDDPENQVLARERLTILGMGRLARQKGFDILIEAFARLAHRHPCWDLVIYGEGPERRALERMRDEYGLGERVAMPGLIADPREAFRRSDLFVLPSRYEGFPNALLEAMASGLPVVASRCPSGPAEIIEDARTGLLVPPEDPSALAAAIEKLMLDEKLRFSLGAAAREVREKYSTDRIVECWSRALAEALG